MGCGVGATAKELIDNDSKAGVACSFESDLPHPTLAREWHIFNGLKWNGEEWQSQPLTSLIMASIENLI